MVKVFRYSVCTALIVCLCLALAVPVLADPAEMLLAKITGTNVNVRAEPSRTGRLTGRFTGGEHAVVLEERSGADPFPWSRVIAFASGGTLVEGWVYGQYVEPLPQDDWSNSAEGDPGERFSRFFDKTLERIGDTPEEAAARFGAPAAREDTRLPGRHDPAYMVDYFRLEYPAFELLYFKTKDSYGLIGVKIVEGEAVIGEGIRLGADAASVVRELGVPLYQKGSAFAWTDEPGYGVLTLTFAEGRVINIDLDVELD